MSIIVNSNKMQDAVRELLEGMGLNPNEPGLKETPRRVANYLLEFRADTTQMSKVWSGVFDASGHEGIVALANIPFRMICEHHLLPAVGHAAIGYIPSEKILGLSKLPRLVDAVGTMRPSLQEKITDQIAELMIQNIKPQGVIVVIRAEHTCLTCRGVVAPGVTTTTSTVHGLFSKVPAARKEFFDMINLRMGEH